MPGGTLSRLCGEESTDLVAATFAADAQASARIERLAMAAVREACVVRASSPDDEPGEHKWPES